MNTFVISGARLRNLTGDELSLNGGRETVSPHSPPVAPTFYLPFHKLLTNDSPKPNK